jgi:hypothetical protein
MAAGERGMAMKEGGRWEERGEREGEREGEKRGEREEREMGDHTHTYTKHRV